MRIAEVTTAREARDFLNLPVNLYRNEPHWIRPLDNDIEAVFDPKRNHAFRHGECTRWVLYDDAGKAIGRVAAFVNRKTVHKGNDQPTGGMGFFECIDDEAAAFKLFDQCKAWLQARGMEAMDGPVNFGSRDRWWGLLVEGFDRDPAYQCNYNFPYYQRLFEAYGFQVYFYQLTFGRKVADPLSDRLRYKAELVARDPDYDFRYLRRDELDKLPEYIHTVYTRAWSNRSENPEISLAQARRMVQQMRPILDRKLLYFGFYKGEPVAMYLSVPEINQYLKHVNGKLDWIGKLKFFWQKVVKGNTKALGVLFGVDPEHQGKGLDGALVMCAARVLQDSPTSYREYEMNWIGDFNPKMIRVVEQVGASVVKRHATYRKLFDESKPFKRAPVLG
jgi:GNAT superfamily N-acetyltransferase